MKKINKQEPIECFSKMLRRSKPKNWDDFHKYHKQVFFDIREHICVNEQDCLCGYTELPIDDFCNCHIDHYKKKNLFHELEFDWDNFVVARMDNEFGAHYKDKHHCKYKKDYNAIINPVKDECHKYFAYSLIGKIEVDSSISGELKNKCENTIKVFNLNDKSLEKRRANLISTIKRFLSGGMSKDDIKNTINKNGFPSALNYYLDIM